VRSPDQCPAPSGAAPPWPSIAILPLTNLSGDVKWERLADGLTEDVITGLARHPDLFVIARNSTMAYKGQSGDVRQVGRELGVRYVLESSVQAERGRVRVTAQLIDAVSGGPSRACLVHDLGGTTLYRRRTSSTRSSQPLRARASSVAKRSLRARSTARFSATRPLQGLRH
jgi:TolB-like protein